MYTTLNFLGKRLIQTRDRQTDSQTDRQTETDTETQRQTETDKETDGQTDRQTETQRGLINWGRENSADVTANSCSRGKK